MEKFILIDANTRRIWAVVENEEMAHKIRAVFISKLSLFVVKMFVDIDNNECLDWKIEKTDYVPQMTHFVRFCSSFGDANPQKTIKKYGSNKIIKEATKTTLSRERIEELQKQILLYQELYQTMGDSIDEVFSIELNIDHITKQLGI